MPEIPTDIPSPLQLALKTGLPITPQLEREVFGPEYLNMRSLGLTPLGVSDTAQKWVSEHKAGYITGVHAEVSPTLEEAQTIVDSFDKGNYSKALSVIQTKCDTLTTQLVGEKEAFEEQIKAYKEQHPDDVADYEKLRELRKKLLEQRFYSTADKIEKQIVASPYYQFKHEAESRFNIFRRAVSQYGSYISALEGKTAEA